LLSYAEQGSDKWKQFQKAKNDAIRKRRSHAQKGRERAHERAYVHSAHRDLFRTREAANASTSSGVNVSAMLTVEGRDVLSSGLWRWAPEARRRRQRCSGDGDTAFPHDRFSKVGHCG
jgi:hypothetical protein